MSSPNMAMPLLCSEKSELMLLRQQRIFLMIESRSRCALNLAQNSNLPLFETCFVVEELNTFMPVAVKNARSKNVFNELWRRGSHGISGGITQNVISTICKASLKGTTKTTIVPSKPDLLTWPGRHKIRETERVFFDSYVLSNQRLPKETTLKPASMFE